MDRCDVVIVGGGPAGSTCAWALRQSGLDVVIVDRATFPRDKVCAGWITPSVVTDLDLDVEAYRQGHTFQPFTGFRVGLIGGDRAVDTEYGHPVSFGIRRSEFDDYLLRRSGARLHLGMPISSLRRDGSLWTVNESLAAPMLVGAGGTFCPVGRTLNESIGGDALVVAQEAEFPVDPGERSSFTTAPERPELYFTPTLDGYGWCLRKENFVNIGFGQADRRRLRGATARFAAFLEDRGTIPRLLSCRWKGHAYWLSGPSRRRLVGDGVLLVGDAAGLACARSGEGIRSAVESGLIAATVIAGARGRYTSAQLRPYDEQVRERFGMGQPSSNVVAPAAPGWLGRSLAPRLLRTSWFVRHVLLDRWFLRVHEAPFAAT